MAETFEEYRTRVLSYLGDEDPIAVQRATPSQLDRSLRDVAREELIRRPAPDKWSIAEIVAHLANAELELALIYPFSTHGRAYSSPQLLLPSRAASISFIELRLRNSCDATPTVASSDSETDCTVELPNNASTL